jgi:hypothetical protein
MTHDQQAELAARLYERRGEAVAVRRAECEIGDDWTPQPSYCHENVDTWVKRNPHHRAVRGWWYCEYVVGTVGVVGT